MRILISSIVDLKRAAHSALHESVKYLLQNHSVTVLSIKDWWKAKQVDTSLYSESFEDILQQIDIIYLTDRRMSPFLQEMFSVWTVDKLLKKLDSHFQVHLNYGTLFSGYVVARKMRALGVDTVYIIPDDLAEMVRTSPQIPPVLRPLGWATARLLVQENIKISKKVTVMIDALARLLDIPDEKCELVPNGVDIELFQSYPADPLRSELGIDGDFVLGYVGVLREWVDFEFVFAAVRHLDEAYSHVKVLVVGEEGKLEKTRELVERYGLSDRVIFSGTIPYARVPQYISCMDVGLIPFKSNLVGHGALPMKLFEYMACEIPVISTDLVGVEHTVGDRILYASTKEELADAIKLLADNTPMAKEMGQKGRQFAEEHYTWAAAMRKLEHILQEAAT